MPGTLVRQSSPHRYSLPRPFYKALEALGHRLNPDRNKDSVRRDKTLFFCLCIQSARRSRTLLRDFLYSCVPDQLHIRQGKQLFPAGSLPHAGCPCGGSGKPFHKVPPGKSHPPQQHPAADHCRHFLLIKSAVTGRTIKYLCQPAVFPGHAKLLCSAPAAIMTAFAVNSQPTSEPFCSPANF